MSRISSVLVTGANGFIGKELCSLLVNRGFNVLAAVRSAAVTPLSGVRMCVVGNLGAHTDWTDHLRGVDAVVHLAGRTHRLSDVEGECGPRLWKVNRDGAVRLGEQAAAAGVSRFIYVSSAKVHGARSGQAPFCIHDAPNPQDEYARVKLEAEEGLKRAARGTGMGLTVLRPPLVYGPEVRANFLKLLRLVARGMPLPLGRVNNARSLIFIGNLADAVSTCLVHPKALGQTFLLSDGQDLSTPELVRQLASAMRRPARLFPAPEALIRAGAGVAGMSRSLPTLLESFRVDGEDIRNRLDWTPPLTLQQGLAETASWYLHLRSR